MKIKTKKITFEQFCALKPAKRKKLKKPSFLFQTLVRLLSVPDLVATRFSYTTSRMEKAGKGPYLILMNHSSFIDLKIASKIFYPKPYFIVCTSDGMVGKEWLMRKIGCIPTQKFVSDAALTRDMARAVKEKKVSVLLFPEAGYSFDGCATTLPRKLGQLVKMLNVPVVSVITSGAFLRQPLYNNLRLRKTKVSAHVSCLITKEEIAEKSIEELDGIIDGAFAFDNFKAQLETKTQITDPHRAEGLNRILYRCPACQTEHQTDGMGSTLVCRHCGKRYEMDVYGQLNATEGETEFPHVPLWYQWQRQCVKEELERGAYCLDLDVDIAVLTDYKALYWLGKGHLTHDISGFHLIGCDGKLDYRQSPTASYSLNSDYYWYEIGDIICIGNKQCLYYCFPKQKDIVTKARLAAEELYKLCKSGKINNQETPV
ncbi:MAG: 1-acyl-sn-glycerol-3-phosphate acyltransferase [Clostridia bacterium]|nr:1-acyl-sn-glycerol-3-phosphate acyltransferase [Clostridia bacterium]